MRRIFLRLAVAFAVVMAAIQLVPYGRDHTNPPITQEPAWDTPRTRVLVARACFDCHSNETTWPWYSYIAPVSWLIERDVTQGRRALNYSEWDRGAREAHEAAKTVRAGEMPPWLYALPRGSGWLTPGERRLLTAGLEQTFGATGPERGGIRTKADDD
jgi:mono/diheme cytochrome c family protein